jgi:mono/diheme cytochrome c family protein
MSVRKTIITTIILTVAVLAFFVTGGAALFVYSGAFNVSATWPHLPAVFWLLQTTAQRSIYVRSANIAVPDLSKPDTITRGLSLFDQNCVSCHGAPGIAPSAFALGLEPGAPPLAETGRVWDVRALYWVIREGIKMTAMPAWQYRLADSDIWALVAFVGMLPTLSPADYRTLVDQHRSDMPNAAQAEPRPQPSAGDAERGRIALHQYACNMCHDIPRLGGAPAHVGPSLVGIATRPYIAGVLSNTPANMRTWIQHPQSITPDTAMPDLGVTDAHARDMAAYLYTLR